MSLNDPVPSSALDVLKRNSEDFDSLVNSDDASVTNRVGKAALTVAEYGRRLSIKESEFDSAIAASGWFAADGSFEDGGAVDTRTKYLTLQTAVGDDPAGGYAWQGALPKTVTAGSTPSGTGGVDEGAWAYLGSADLRSELSSGGADIYGVSNIVSVINYDLQPYPSDNTAPINSALADCAALGGGIALLPAGVFRALGIQIPTNVILKGAGKAATLIESTSTTSSEHVIKNSDQTNGNINIGVEDLTVDDRRTSGNAIGSCCVSFNKVDGFHLKKVNLSNPQTHGFVGSRVRNGLVEDCHASIFNTYTDAPDDGFSISDQGYSLDADRSENITFFACTSDGFNDNSRQGGFECDDGPQNIKYIGCVTRNSYAGFTAHTHDEQMSVDNITYINCTSIDTVLSFVSHSRSNAPVNDLSYSNCKAFNASQEAFRFEDRGGIVSGVTMTDCLVDGAAIGLRNEYLSDMKVIGCDFKNAAQVYDVADSPDYVFIGNTPSNNTFSWTPIVSDDPDEGVGNNATLNIQYAAYWLDGTHCHVSVDVRITSVAGMTAGNTLRIKGFPFKAASIGLGMQRIPFSVQATNMATSNGSPQGLFQQGDNGDNMIIGSQNSAGVVSYVTVGDVTTDATIRFDFSYRI